MNIDTKSLIEKLNNYCTNALEASTGLCVSKTHYEITIEHFLIKLIENSDADIQLILEYYNLDRGQFLNIVNRSMSDQIKGNSSRPVFNPFLIEWIKDSWITATLNFNQHAIRSGHLLFSYLDPSAKYTNEIILSFFKLINKEQMKIDFELILEKSIEQCFSLVQSKTGTINNEAEASTESIKKFCINFTQKAISGEIDPVFGRDDEIRQMIDILARRRKNNPIIVGEAGVGKTALVEGLSLRITEDDVPDFLKDVTILGLDMGLLQAGASVKGEFENRLKAVIKEVNASLKPIIMFIDEAHMLIGAGGKSGGSDAANLLKPALARGELRTIAATTWSEYKQFFEEDQALERRFQIVKLNEPSVEVTTLILRGLKENYEKKHGIVIRDDAVKAAAELSKRYITGRFLPDKAIDVLDTSAARLKILLSTKPDNIENKVRMNQALEREKNALIRDQLHNVEVDELRLKEIDKLINEFSTEIEVLTSQWEIEKQLAFEIIDLRKQVYHTESEEERNTNKQLLHEKMAVYLEIQKSKAHVIPIEVDPNLVARVVSNWTGVPFGIIKRNDAETILSLEQNLQKKIKGQKDAIQKIVKELTISNLGIKASEKPLGVFLLVGPNGVGKTETGLAVADILFGGERSVISLNMSEFHGEHTVSRLIGAPPGFVGYGKGGKLTEAVRQRPYSVILIDELEKAHQNVLNIFYQIFDKGTLTDNEGKQVDFKNTVIFLTSNISGDTITKLAENKEISYDIIYEEILPILKQAFTTAFISHTRVVPFLTLDRNAIREIVTTNLDHLINRLSATHQFEFRYSNTVTEKIVERCINVESGARNIVNIMNGTILPEISLQLLKTVNNQSLPKKAEMIINTDGNFEMIISEPVC